VVKRGTLFAVWVLLGAILSYGALYAFTPFGLAIIGACLAASMAVPSVGRSRWPEGLGLLAGPGLFCFVVAASVDQPLPFLGAGAALIAAALIAYGLAGRRQCIRSS
jgi:hypothetical protein